MAHNKTILEKANALITAGDYDGFLTCCTEDTVWTFIGDQTLRGKHAVRHYIAKAYIEPPKFMVETLIEEDDYVTAIGMISMKDNNGKLTDYSYCDVWRFEN